MMPEERKKEEEKWTIKILRLTDRPGQEQAAVVP